MRRARLSAPPRFSLAEQAPGWVTLAADTGAIAHLFVAEEDVVRLLLLPDGRLRSPPSWAIAPGASDIADPGRDRLSLDGFSCPPFAFAETDTELVLTTARIRLTIARTGLRCRWEQHTADGWALMAADRATQAYNFGWWGDRVAHYLERQPGERWFALGEKTGPMDRAGRCLRLTNLDAMGYDAESGDPLYKHIPYVLTADAAGRCHGAFYDNTSDMTFDFGQERDNYHGLYRRIEAAAGDIDLWMIAGPDPLAVTRRFTWLTGRPALMPRWSLGYSGSTMQYTDAADAEAQMLGFVDQLAAHDLGCSSFHLSSGYTSIGAKRYVFHWNRDKFPDPAGFAARYAAAGIRLVANIKPALLIDHPRFAEAAAGQLFLADDAGDPTELQYWDEIGAALDFTNPATARWWREQVRSALLEHGIAATWNDNNECEVWDPEARAHGFGAPLPAAEVRPLQPLLMTRASRRAQQEFASAVRPFVVSRAGMAGLQRYAQTWSGDNCTAWKSLRFNVRMGLGLALSGISNSGHDVGGFAGPRPDPELFVRWVQAGVLMPRFSIHSWNDDGSVSEPWMYPAAMPAVRRLLAFRQALVPLFDDLAWRYHAHYQPMIRPLWLEFPDDAAAWADGEAHLLGRDVIACPVVEPGRDSVEIALPAGADWFDFHRGTFHRGGQTITVPAPLDGLPPLLVRAGVGVLLDGAAGGFRPAPRALSLHLFPAPGRGQGEWCGYEPDPEAADPPERAWRAAWHGDEQRLSITVTAPEPGAAPLELVLPAAETRVVVVVGAVRLASAAGGG